MICFKREIITPSVSRIWGTPDVCMYLVEGSERAALIDTGNGAGDLKGYVEGILGQKPVDVIITHGHVDHASGAGQFERVYMSELDYDLSLRHCAAEHRMSSMERCRAMFPGTMPEIAEEDLIPVKTKGYLPLDDGQEFALGGITLRMIHVPGHTKGMMAVLDVEERIAFFGDACGVGVLMITEEASTIAEYQKSLMRLKQFSGQFDRVLRQHGTCESSCAVLDDNIEVCGRILTGTDDAVPAMFGELSCIRAMEIDPETGMRIDGREGNILYLPEKIR